MRAFAAASSGDAGSAVLGIIVILASIAAYWVPAAVAWIRRVPNAGSVTVINLFLGWTIIGWVAALAMACRSRPQAAYQATPIPLILPQPGQPLLHVDPPDRGSGRP